MNGIVASTNASIPKVIPPMPWASPPVVYRNRGPIRLPCLAKTGADKKAARLTMPNTKPY